MSSSAVPAIVGTCKVHWRTLVPCGVLLLAVLFIPFTAYSSMLPNLLLPLLAGISVFGLLLMLHPAIATAMWSAVFLFSFVSIYIAQTGLLIVEDRKLESGREHRSSMGTTIGSLMFNYFFKSVSWGLWPIVARSLRYLWNKSNQGTFVETTEHLHDAYLFACFGCILAIGAILLLATHRQTAVRKSVLSVVLVVAGVVIAAVCLVNFTTCCNLLLRGIEQHSQVRLSAYPSVRDILIQSVADWRRATTIAAVTAFVGAATGLYGTAQGKPSASSNQASK